MSKHYEEINCSEDAAAVMIRMVVNGDSSLHGFSMEHLEVGGKKYTVRVDEE